MEEALLCAKDALAQGLQKKDQVGPGMSSINATTPGNLVTFSDVLIIFIHLKIMLR